MLCVESLSLLMFFNYATIENVTLFQTENVRPEIILKMTH